jgi:hypothetical protein
MRQAVRVKFSYAVHAKGIPNSKLQYPEKFQAPIVTSFAAQLGA